jgi:hypothetical protein
VAVLSLVACAPAVSVVRAPAAQPAAPPERVRVYLDEADAPARYRELGLVLANTHVFVPVNFYLDTFIAIAAQRLPSGNQVCTPVWRALVRRAARLGADGLIIKTVYKSGNLLSIAGVAIRSGVPDCGDPPPS